jgi:hypothetical protein
MYHFQDKNISMRIIFMQKIPKKGIRKYGQAETIVNI